LKSGEAGIKSPAVTLADFGTHQIVANRFQPTNVAYVLDLEYWSVDYLRPVTQEKLAKTGDSDRVMLITEFTLACKSPNSSAQVRTLTTS